MSTEETWRIKTCTLEVNIQCAGCKEKVMKTLKKIAGVYAVDIDGEVGKLKVKVTSSENVDSSTLIKKLKKVKKSANILGASEHNLYMSDQFKNLKIDDSSGGGGSSGGSSGGGGCSSSGGSRKGKSHVLKIHDDDDDDDDDDEFYDAMESHPVIMG